MDRGPLGEPPPLTIKASPSQWQIHGSGPDSELVEQAIPQAGHQQQADQHQHSPTSQLEQPEPLPQGGEAADRPTEPQGGDQERDAKAQRVGEQQDRATPHAATADRGQAEYGAQRRPDTRRPPKPEHHPKRQRARQPAGDPVGPEPPLLVEEGGLEHPGKDRATPATTLPSWRPPCSTSCPETPET